MQSARYTKFALPLLVSPSPTSPPACVRRDGEWIAVRVSSSRSPVVYLGKKAAFKEPTVGFKLLWCTEKAFLIADQRFKELQMQQASLLGTPSSSMAVPPKRSRPGRTS